MWLRCIDCGHEFQARNRYVPSRQCGQCYSTKLEEIDRAERRMALLDGHTARDLFLAFDKGKNPIECVEDFALDPKVVGYAFTWYLRLKKLWVERTKDEPIVKVVEKLCFKEHLPEGFYHPRCSVCSEPLMDVFVEEGGGAEELARKWCHVRC